MVERRVILGVQWIDDLPHVRVRDDSQKASRLLPLLGLDLSFRASPDSPRLCLGHKPFRSGGPSYVDCLSRPQPGSRTCRACAVVEATFASNLHHAHTKEAVGVDPDIAAHLRQPNLLYLAAFRNGSLKVGTSTERRLRVRLAEQGAWVARVVAWARDGVSVRLLEDLVTERLELPQAVSAAKKLAGLVRPVLDESLEADIDARRDDVHELLVDRDTFEPMDEPWRHPRADGDWSGVHRYPLDLATGAHELVVDDACGRLALVRRAATDDLEINDRFAVDLQSLFGVEVDVGNFGSTPLAVQDSLF